MKKYEVYYAPDGATQQYCGEFDSYEEAAEAAEQEPEGLTESLWETARAAGHVGGMYAPSGGDEDDEPLSWHGADGFYCVIGVSRGAL